MGGPLPHHTAGAHACLATLWLEGAWPESTAVPNLDAVAGEDSKRLLKHVDDVLGSRCRDEECPKWLSADPIALMVKEAVEFRNRSLYELHAWIIMPNHVHILFSPITGAEGGRPVNFVADIVGRFKSFTGQRALEILRISGTGKFWSGIHHLYFVDGRDELFRANDYIVGDPERSGLVRDVAAWKWKGSKYRHRDLGR